ncbi:Non-classical phosphatidylinositol transfer protein (PITP) [Tulasnella sp. 419]|nr:Non-classical phosphatidylinositol transfer protein (PITP) [Tulasnella sp. 419]
MNPTDAPSTTVEPELESPLTKAFTPAEWDAVKELRTALPLIFGEAFKDLKDEATALEPVEIWGVSLDPNKGGIDDPRISVILVKFLRARNLNVDEATKMLAETLKWRHTFKAAETADEEFPDDVFGKIGYVYGKDKGGRPITYNVYGGNSDLEAVFGDTERFLRWRVGLMEKGLRLIDFINIDSMVQVHDYDGVGMSSRTAASKKAAADASKIFQDYYPELLHKKYFINVPALMAWVFWAFKPFVSSQTFAKLQMVGRGPETIAKELLPAIDKSELPKRYGGEAEGF